MKQPTSYSTPETTPSVTIFPASVEEMQSLPISKETAEVLFAIRQLTTVVYGTIYGYVTDENGEPYNQKRMDALDKATDTLKGMLEDILTKECLKKSMMFYDMDSI